MEQRDMPKVDFITSIVLIVFSIGVIWQSIMMPRFENRGANPLSVPGIVPGLLGIIIGLMGLILLIRSIRNKGYVFGWGRKTVAEFGRKPATIRLFLTLLACLVYAWGLVGRIHFVPATLVFVFAFIMLFEFRRQATRKEKIGTTAIALLIAVLVSTVVSAVFRYVFLVNLP